MAFPRRKSPSHAGIGRVVSTPKSPTRRVGSSPHQYVWPLLTFLLGLYLGSLQNILHHHHRDNIGNNLPGIDTAESVLASFLNQSTTQNNDEASSSSLLTETVRDLKQRLTKCEWQRQQNTEGNEERLDPLIADERTIPESQSSSQQDRLQHRHAICHRLSNALSSSSSSSDSTTTTTITIPSAMQVWTRFLKRIHRASQLTYNDPRYYFHDFTAQLLQIVTPRLPRSVSSLPRDWKRVEVILNKLERRYSHIRLLQQQPNNTTLSSMPLPPPVKIVVLGGSVLVGRNCRKLFTDMGMQMTLPNRHCTYSNRLQAFLNQIFSPNNTMFEPSKKTKNLREPPPPQISSGAVSLFQVTKIAMGGTNTAVGSQVLEYDLLPPEARQPDIVLNAYSTNDMHILTILEAQNKGNVTLRHRVFDMTQDFVRKVMDPSSEMAKNYEANDDGTCDDSNENNNKDHEPSVPPLLLHMDDYLGNEQREILATTELAQGVGVLAQYYGFASMSYANLVRDIVYGDSYESWFSAQGWWPHPDKRQAVEQTMEREIHPNMGMHIVAMWVVVYNLLNMVTTFCSIQDFLPQEPRAQSRHEQADWPVYSASTMAQTIPLNGAYSEAPGKPKLPPSSVALPPSLNETLSLEHVTQEWNRLALQAAEKRLSSATSTHTDTASCAAPIRCPFSWVSGLSMQQNDEKYIQQLFDSYIVHGEGAATAAVSSWKLLSDGGKLGFVPSKIGDSVQLQFDNVPQAITTVTFFFLKSYGPKWENSQVTVNVSARKQDGWQPLLDTPRQLSGIHGKETSEMYTEPIDLSREVPAGETLRIMYELTGGQTFKLMGLAVCS